MRWKKLFVIGGAIASCPVALIVAAIIADKFYMRFMFNYEISDFSPGDAFGEIFVAILFTVPLLIVILLAWVRLYRRISNQPNAITPTH
jgi:hypothetical protein